jgi:hypothetical protein
MSEDSIVREVREIREALGRQFGYDLDALHLYLKEQEQAGGRRVVSFPPKRIKPLDHQVGDHRREDFVASKQARD